MTRENSLENVDFGLDSYWKAVGAERYIIFAAIQKLFRKIIKTRKELKFGGKKWKKERQ